ncbi:tetratricopeptide repeat protein [Puniceicoccales bacterium CK1056]|uniref:Tetratricopeptide repeat protein n=1 Tax=Oceanipulchritudo coccoides TaxID=2706888 RepID=A0A6B2LZ43_9BACT|nr:tetratricopeptide repeat protein [Oceanipulchritudo coccoides]NDV61908.1 tetratricopeptide repeat protein [Oceanipulchritudo coccoides]
MKKRISPRRLWAMRLMAMVIIPVLFIGGLELLLRVTGFGYPTTFFLPSRLDGKEYLIPNYKFSYRFFPPALARVPLVFRMPAEKPEGTYRIFLFGESAALGDPEPSYGVGRQLEILLENRYPGREFEVINVAMTAINSHVILPIARECARLDGDLWLIYMGNNEMVGPFGAGTVFGSKAPSLWFVRLGLALKTTKIGQLLTLLSSVSDGGEADSGNWAGIDMFKENQLRLDDPNRLQAYENFRGNLEDILKAGRKAGVPVLLSTVGSNLKDCSPFASLHREGLDSSQEAKWDALFSEGNAFEEAGDFASALGKYEEAAEIDSDYAELQFRIGTCLLKLSKPIEAKEAFVRARDLDALAVRADTRINAIVNETALNSEGQVVLVDGVDLLARQSSDTIPDQNLFYEHVHFTTKGNYILARAFAEEVAQFLPPTILEAQEEEWIRESTCLKQLALTTWDTKRLWQTALGRINVSPFKEQSSHSRTVSHIREQLGQIDKGITMQTPWRDRSLYIAALRRAPEDTMLLGNYAQFLDGTGSGPEAIEQARRFCDMLPDLAWPHYYLGVLLLKGERFAEAKESFERALEIRSNFKQAANDLKTVERKLNRLN